MTVLGNIMKLKVELTEEDVEKAITHYLQSQGYEVHNVEIKVSMEWTGYHTDERQEATFQGATAMVEPKKDVGTNSLAHQYEMVEKYGGQENR